MLMKVPTMNKMWDICLWTCPCATLAARNDVKNPIVPHSEGTFELIFQLAHRLFCKIIRDNNTRLLNNYNHCSVPALKKKKKKF